jgi:hypothetical protein
VASLSDNIYADCMFVSMSNRIDPAEDLFTFTRPTLSKNGDAGPCLPTSSALFGSDLQESMEGTPVNPANATMGFSMFHGNITRRTGKKMTVYQLLLDSQLELKRFVC